MALLEPGDTVRLQAVRAESVLPNDIYWGTQAWPKAALRKGYILESEGMRVLDGAIPAPGGQVRIASYLIDADDLVLIEAR